MGGGGGVSWELACQLINRSNAQSTRRLPSDNSVKSSRNSKYNEMKDRRRNGRKKKRCRSSPRWKIEKEKQERKWKTISDESETTEA